MLPPLLELSSEQDYCEHYMNTLVNGEAVKSKDGITVVFLADQFNHAFSGYSSKWDKEKSIFDRERAKRMDWIAPVIQGVASESFCDKYSARRPRRNYLSSANKYLVVTEPISGNREKFITAFPCSDKKAAEVRKRPRWTKNSRC